MDAGWHISGIQGASLEPSGWDSALIAEAVSSITGQELSSHQPHMAQPQKQTNKQTINGTQHILEWRHLPRVTQPWQLAFKPRPVLLQNTNFPRHPDVLLC